uniref:Putative DNA recombination protein n=1 Tax=viral metagenome TaxID=1070528 RepID=A0A6M3K2K1_9ZZZZ
MVAKEERTEVAQVEPTYSHRFANMVVKEFSSEVGVMTLTPYQRRLAQHMFIAVDTQLKNLEVKRLDQGGADKGTPIVWQNINMNKLAIDAVHRVELGLDALIPNHIHPIPYFNKRKQKYDLDLRIGFAGKDCYRRKVALDPPIDIIYELVHEKDTFKPIKKSLTGNESYEFEITNPFDRGEVVGGFGYIMHEDPRKNRLIIVTKADFDKSKKLAKSDTFWKNHEREMQYKTLVHRTTEKINIDPEKVNASFLKVEIDDTIQGAERDIDEKANKGFMGEEGEVVEAEFSATEGDEGKGAESENGNGKSFADWIKQYDEILGTDIVDEEFKKKGAERDKVKPGQRKDVLAGLAQAVAKMDEGGVPDF